jgi:hypothetical protein
MLADNNKPAPVEAPYRCPRTIDLELGATDVELERKPGETPKDQLTLFGALPAKTEVEK